MQETQGFEDSVHEDRHDLHDDGHDSEDQRMTVMVENE